MSIAPDNKCIKCSTSNNLETLEHIFLYCPVSKIFRRKLDLHINSNLLQGYSDPDSHYFITCSHENNGINYLNLSAKWYLSRCYQMEIPVSWTNYVNSLEKTLTGETKSLQKKIRDSFP